MNYCPAKISTCERLSFNLFLFWKVKKAKGKQGQMTSHMPEQSQVPGRARLIFFSSIQVTSFHWEQVSLQGHVCTCAMSLFSLVWSKRLGRSGVHQRN